MIWQILALLEAPHDFAATFRNGELYVRPLDELPPNARMIDDRLAARLAARALDWPAERLLTRALERDSAEPEAQGTDD